MSRRFPSILALLLAAGVLSACGGVDSDESQPVVTEPDQGLFTATFKPASAQVPFPNDIFFSGTADGTLNIPASAANPGLTAMNFLDGYSTTASIYVDTTDTIDADTLEYEVTVFLFNAETQTLVPATVARADYAGGTSVIEIVPITPLIPGTRYAGFVTTGVQSTAGDSLGRDTSFQSLLDVYATGAPAGTDLGDPTSTALYEALQPLFAASELAGFGGENAQNLAVAWSFKTQSIDNSLAAIEASAAAQTNGFVPVPGAAGGIATAGELLMPASDLNDDGTPDIGTQADVYIGMIEMPYYTTDPLTGYWVPDSDICAQVVTNVPELTEQPESTTVACPTPAEQDTFRVPVLLTVPNAGAPGGDTINGVTIFQHGITSDRSSMLALAGALADAQQAQLAIDLPLHGITDETSPLYAGNLQDTFDGLVEQTFDIDADEDGEIDASGEHFINLTSLLTTRDSLRQAAANLIYLAKTIPTMDYNAALDGGATPDDFAGKPISFVGMSLGAMTGTAFLATNMDANAAVLSVPGGVVTELLTNSATFAPVINAGLEENGVIAGTRFYEEFLRNAQTVVDSGDPINYAAVAKVEHPVLMHSVIGGAGNPPDQVIPNSATDALAAAMGLTQITATTGGVGTEVDGIVKFTAGSHSSLLDPSSSAAVTTEMQTQVANYVGSGGTLILITEGSVIDQ